MGKKVKYIVIIVLVLISITTVFTYSYFKANVESNNVNDFSVGSGSLDVKIVDSSVTSVDLSPIYDEDYEMLAYHKTFEVVSNSSLNACSKIFLSIKEISDALKSENFKYKIIYNNNTFDGNFKSAENNKDLLLLDNLFIESNSTHYFDLYIWVSYRDDEDQMNMLSTTLNSSLTIKSIDAKNSSKCTKE